MKIGFIGMGIMGSRMAGNLLKAGHSLSVFNRDASKCEPLVNNGATLCSTPKDACLNAELVFSMVADPLAIKAVTYGDDGILAGLAADAIWVDCSTIGPSESTALATAAEEKGCKFLEAPVAGSKAPAASGELTFLVGGPSDLLERAQPLLDVMGAKTVHLGDHGSAGAFKLVLNHMLGVSMAAFSEGVALGKSLGIAPDKLFEALLGTPMVPPYLAIKKPKILDGELEADFPLKWMNKDMALVTQAAYENDVAMPIANSAKELYRLAQLHGHADNDFAAVYHYLTENNSD
ncbi:MAG: NAD(P)-dependent oxidoreductase [Pseudomonadota bacterium]